MFIKKKMALAVCLASNSVLALAAGPDAGILSNQVKQEREALRPLPHNESTLVMPKPVEAAPAAPQAGDAAVLINRVVFVGDWANSKEHVPSEQMLQEVVKPFLNKALTFNDMNAMAHAVTQAFRQQGLPVARAILPAQTIQNETLTLQILLGRYDQTQLQNATGLSDTLVKKIISKPLASGEVITKQELVHTAMLLGEIPGVRSNISLEPGDKPGTSKPVINLQPGQKWGGYVGLNNHGDSATGRDHVEGAIYANNLAGLGDQLIVQLQDAYRDNDLINGSVDYSVLAGPLGTRVGANYSRLDYSHTYQKLDFKGYSDTWNIYAVQPLVRTEDARIDARVELGQQFLKDTYPDSLSQLLKLESQGRKRVDASNFALFGSLASFGGISDFNVKATLGYLSYQNDTARFWNGSDLRDTKGTFAKLNYAFSHERALWANLSAYAGLTGQKASKNMDGSQKLQMGGPNAIRAYDLGDGLVDEGDILTAELRSRWNLPAYPLLGRQPMLTIAPFYDFGRGAQYRDNVFNVSDNYFNLAGGGLSAVLSDPGNYEAKLVWAHRTGSVDPVSGQDDKNRLWLSLNKYF